MELSLPVFVASLALDTFPPDLTWELEALWLAQKGRWDDAHTLTQSMNELDSARIHAFLHRQEGDLTNAAYWYRRAGVPIMSGPLDEEWKILATHYLKQSRSGR